MLQTDQAAQKKKIHRQVFPFSKLLIKPRNVQTAISEIPYEFIHVEKVSPFTYLNSEDFPSTFTVIGCECGSVHL